MIKRHIYLKTFIIQLKSASKQKIVSIVVSLSSSWSAVKIKIDK